MKKKHETTFEYGKSRDVLKSTRSLFRFSLKVIFTCNHIQLHTCSNSYGNKKMALEVEVSVYVIVYNISRQPVTVKRGKENQGKKETKISIILGLIFVR